MNSSTVLQSRILSMEETKALMYTQVDDELGGFLIPPSFVINTALKCGIELPDLPEYYEMKAAIEAKPLWWRWLFEKCYINKAASFIVFIFPKVPEIRKWEHKLMSLRRQRLELRQKAAIDAWPQIMEYVKGK